METEGILQQLTADISQATDFVQDILETATNQHKSLKKKAQRLKNQIQDGVSLHLELLRNREVWLLDQVDILLQLKEESIEGRQKELVVLLAKLEVYLGLLQTTNIGESAEVEVEVGKFISSIKKEDLNLEVVPDIGFLLNNFVLRDAIKNFGSVAEELMEISTGETKCHTPSPSTGDFQFLQEHFNAVFDSPVKDWLVPTSSSANEHQSSEDKTPPGVKAFFIELGRSDVKDWLHESNQKIDPETAINNLSRHFYEVMQEPTVNWLKPNSAPPVSNDTIQFTPFCMSESQDTWLLTSVTCEISDCRSNICDKPSDCDKQDVRRESSLVGNGESDVIVDDDWLFTAKNIDEAGHCMKLEENASSEMTNNWLLPTKGMTPNDEQMSHGEGWLERFRDSIGKHTSDWLVVSEVVPEYCEWLSRDSIDRCKGCPGECARDSMKVFRNIFNSSRNEWLTTVKDW